MQIDRRITSGLAWAGLFIVVAVPVADAVSGQLMGDQDQITVASIAAPPALVAPVPAPLSQRPQAPAAQPVVETAAVAPAKPIAPPVAKPAASANPIVDSFLSAGKPLPSYITGAQDAPQQTAAATPAVSKPVVTAPVQPAAVPGQPVAPVAASQPVDPIEVATLTPARIAPMPMPLSMRPKPVSRPLATQPVNEDIVLPPEVVAGNDARPVVVDDLQDWESGPLSEFLAQRQRSSAVVTQNDAYEDRPVRRPRRDVYLGPADDEFFFPFIN